MTQFLKMLTFFLMIHLNQLQIKFWLLIFLIFLLWELNLIVIHFLCVCQKTLLKNGSGDKDKKSEIIAKQKYILSITENGFGKRTSFYEYRVTNRGGKGIIGIVNSSRNGNVAASFPVNEGDEVILSTDKGKVIRCAVKEIRIGGRNTQGVRIFKLSGEEKVVSAIKIEDNFI